MAATNCDRADWDPFQQTLTLERAQVVNGGQTIRAISRASGKGALKSDVVVAARAIASSAEKDFANNVAVNQNNQNMFRNSSADGPRYFLGRLVWPVCLTIATFALGAAGIWINAQTANPN